MWVWFLSNEHISAQVKRRTFLKSLAAAAVAATFPYGRAAARDVDEISDTLGRAVFSAESTRFTQARVEWNRDGSWRQGPWSKTHALDNIDFRLTSIQAEDKAGYIEFSGICPYTTGDPRVWKVDIATYHTDSNHLDIHARDISHLGFNYPFIYLAQGSIYDNKIHNSAKALRDFAGRAGAIAHRETMNYVELLDFGNNLEEALYYLPGYGVEKGKLVQMDAGGTCASASVLAKAAALAHNRWGNLVYFDEIHPHLGEHKYFVNPYFPLKTDATIYYPGKNLKIRNVGGLDQHYVVKADVVLPDDQEASGRYHSMGFPSTALFAFSIALGFQVGDSSSVGGSLDRFVDYRKKFGPQGEDTYMGFNLLQP
jgi:hypothetical protein